MKVIIIIMLPATILYRCKAKTKRYAFEEVEHRNCRKKSGLYLSTLSLQRLGKQGYFSNIRQINMGRQSFIGKHIHSMGDFDLFMELAFSL